MLDAKVIDAELQMLHQLVVSAEGLEQWKRDEMLNSIESMATSIRGNDQVQLENGAAGFGKWLLFDLDLAESPIGEKCFKFVNHILVPNAQRS